MSIETANVMSGASEVSEISGMTKGGEKKEI
jgi:hypothetical protein